MIAANYLRRYNYILLDHNFHSKFGELDLVMLLNNEYIFIEVKSLNVNSEYSIYQSFSKQKYNRVNKTAQYWLRKHNLENSIYRIEFIGIISYLDKYYLEHFKYIDF